MTRPLYETDEDLKREEAYLQDLKDYFGCGAVKLPIKYRLDYALLNGEEITGWLEIRIRNNRSDAYTEYMISMDKWFKGIELYEQTNKPFFLAVRFLDKDMLFKYVGIGMKAIYRGRTKNIRDWQDTEPVIMIPMKYFLEVIKSAE